MQSQLTQKMKNLEFHEMAAKGWLVSLKNDKKNLLFQCSLGEKEKTIKT